MSKERIGWAQVRTNPTLFEAALDQGEGEVFHWHDDANLPHSSQVFCVSAFGSLRRVPVRHMIVTELLGGPYSGQSLKWSINLEVERPRILAEFGGHPSSIDVVLQSATSVFCVESKFKTDAHSGFGCCSQRPKNCVGFFGPGSDRKNKTGAWCRLEVWDKNRSPRAYWSIGRAYFQESVYEKQIEGMECPFGGPNYQLMRNFLFAASMSHRLQVENFGVVVMCPERNASKLEKQIESFQSTILRSEFIGQVRLLTYERLIEILRQSGDTSACLLADFLERRINDLIV